jgi:hypothetical protein
MTKRVLLNAQVDKVAVVTYEKTVKVFISVVTVYYLRFAAWTRLIVWAVV